MSFLGYFNVDVYSQVVSIGCPIDTAYMVAELANKIEYYGASVILSKTKDQILSLLAISKTLDKFERKHRDAVTKALAWLEKIKLIPQKKDCLIANGGSKVRQSLREKKHTCCGANKQDDKIIIQYNSFIFKGFGHISLKIRHFLQKKVEDHGYDVVLGVIKQFANDKWAKSKGYEDGIFIGKFENYLNKDVVVAPKKEVANQKNDDDKKNRAWQSYLKDNKDIQQSDIKWHKYDHFTDSWYVDNALAPDWYIKREESLFNSIMQQCHKRFMMVSA